MSDAFSKIESFLFDILGLVLPGVIFFALLIFPISLIDISKIPPKIIDSSFILSELSTISKIIKSYWMLNSSLVITVIIILSYLIGHFIKVFAIIKYEFLTAIFDKSINKWVIWVFDKLKLKINNVVTRIFHVPMYDTKLYKWLKYLYLPFKTTLIKIFVFRPPDYFSDNNALRTTCVSIINTRIGSSYPDKWYSVYKFSSIINSQENIKSLASSFLAKYNLYRSLAFIFIFSTIYYYFFFKASANYILPELKKIVSLILLLSISLWFTFHYKYKRYWTLCGNETLVSLYYFLNKKKINET